jgi:hypothetical protein
MIRRYLLPFGVSYFIGSYAFAGCPTDLVQMHDTYVKSAESAILSQAGSNDIYVYYALTYHINGIISGLECTKNEARLQFLISVLDKSIAAARDYNGDGMVEWQPLDTKGRPIQHHFKYTATIARAAAFIVGSDEFSVKYGGKAQGYINFAHNDVIKRWYINVSGERIPYVEDGGSATTWSGKASTFLEVVANLYAATRNPYYRNILERGALSFKQHMHPMGTGWFWYNGAGPTSGNNSGGVEDTSHGNSAARFVIFAYEAGVGFTKDDVLKLSNTFTENLWNKSLSDPRFANYVNGSNLIYYDFTAWGNGQVYAGWALFAAHSLKGQQATSAILNAIRARVVNPSIAVNNNLYGHVSLTGHLLRSYAGTAPAPTVDTTPPVITIISPINGTVVKR